MNEIERKTAALEGQFGTDLLSYGEVAQILRRSESSLRWAIGGGSRHQRWVRRLAAGRVRLGRRTFFRASAVAAVWYWGDAPFEGAGEGVAAPSPAAHKSPR